MPPGGPVSPANKLKPAAAQKLPPAPSTPLSLTPASLVFLVQVEETPSTITTRAGRINLVPTRYPL